MKSRGQSAPAKSKSKRPGTWVKLQGGPTIACIDMGTNSFHMIVCQATEERDHFEVLLKVKEAVPFFRRALSAHFIDDVAIRSALRILKDMIKKAGEFGAATVLAVATSAVRESKNGEEVLQRIRDDLGIDAKMISGKEEARLIYLGVLWSMPELTERFTIVDIGGGSTELITADRNQTFFTESYKLGAARLTQRFFRRGIPTAEYFQEMHDEVKGVLRPAAARVEARGGHGKLIGTSGTIQTLAKMDRERMKSPYAVLHGWTITIERLRQLVEYIEETALKGDRIKGVSADRNQTILAGAIVLLETMRSLGADELVVCSAALREGVIVDRCLQTGWLEAGLEHHRDPRSHSVFELLEKYAGDFEHATQVAKLSSEIFLQSQGVLHNYPEDVGHLLWSAAMLHDVGMFIGRNGHHKHSYYLIKHGGFLGHSEEEIGIIASIARYHRGSEPKDSHEAFFTIAPEDRKLVEDLSAILRVAEALDRSHRQVIEEIVLDFDSGLDGDHRDGSSSQLTMKARIKTGQSCESENWALNEKKAYFEEHFAVKLVFQEEKIESAPRRSKSQSG